jgi:hypothetical protein
VSGEQRPDEQNAPAQSPVRPKEDDREKTLTEKEEEEHGGANKQTPGPIYDV